MKNKLKLMSFAAAGAIAAAGFVTTANASTFTPDKPDVKSSLMINVHDHMGEKAKEMKEKHGDKESYGEKAKEHAEDKAEEAKEHAEDKAEEAKEETSE